MYIEAIFSSYLLIINTAKLSVYILSAFYIYTMNTYDMIQILKIYNQGHTDFINNFIYHIFKHLKDKTMFQRLLANTKVDIVKEFALLKKLRTYNSKWTIIA